MSQFVSAKIERRLAQLAQVAWPDVTGKADLGVPLTVAKAPKIASFCPEVPRDPGTIRNNRFQYTCTVYGRFPITANQRADDKDQRANDLYEAVIASDPQRVGVLYDADGNFLANNLRVASFDRQDYMDEADRPKCFDVTVTFTMQADAVY